MRFLPLLALAFAACAGSPAPNLSIDPTDIPLTVQTKSVDNYTVWLVVDGFARKIGDTYGHRSPVLWMKKSYFSGADFSIGVKPLVGNGSWLDQPMTLAPGRELVLVINDPLSFSYVYQK